MKPNFKILAAVLAATLLAGCAAKSTESSEASQPLVSTATEISSVTQSGSESVPESRELPDDVKKLLEKCPNIPDYTDANGDLLSPYDITHIEYPTEENGHINSLITYGSAFITYALPIYASTLDGDDWKSDGDGFSDAMEWVVYRSEEADKALAKRKCFEVKPGDVLENGLTVKSAETVYEAFEPDSWADLNSNPYWTFGPLRTTIEFEGTLTLEGILFKYEGNPDYFSSPNDVFFYPDTTKNAFVPKYSDGDNALSAMAILSPNHAVVHDGEYYLGNLNTTLDLFSADYDVDEVLGDTNYARVKITLKDITLGILNGATAQRAKIADVEVLD